MNTRDNNKSIILLQNDPCKSACVCDFSNSDCWIGFDLLIGIFLIPDMLPESL